MKTKILAAFAALLFNVPVFGQDSTPSVVLRPPDPLPTNTLGLGEHRVLAEAELQAGVVSEDIDLTFETGQLFAGVNFTEDVGAFGTIEVALKGQTKAPLISEQVSPADRRVNLNFITTAPGVYEIRFYVNRFQTANYVKLTLQYFANSSEPLTLDVPVITLDPNVVIDVFDGVDTSVDPTITYKRKKSGAAIATRNVIAGFITASTIFGKQVDLRSTITRRPVYRLYFSNGAGIKHLFRHTFKLDLFKASADGTELFVTSAVKPKLRKVVPFVGGTYYVLEFPAIVLTVDDVVVNFREELSVQVLPQFAKGGAVSVVKAPGDQGQSVFTDPFGVETRFGSLGQAIEVFTKWRLPQSRQ